MATSLANRRKHSSLTSASWDTAALTGRTRSHVREVSTLRCALQPAAASALLAMRAAASADGIDLVPVSGFRDFERQLAIWNGKFLGSRPLTSAAGAPLEARCLTPEERVDAILMWSALPGASRHHWGTDCDVVDAATMPDGYQVRLEAEEYGPGGIFARLTTWLDAHMHRFGFFRPYATFRGGVRPELWHLSYAPLAAAAQRALVPGVLREAITVSDLEGREIVLDRIDELYARFVGAVDAPPRVARLSPRLF